MIVLDNITKTYKVGFFYRKVRAVKNASLHVQKGEIFGFIGANGAGKTTIIKMILGIALPTSGKGSLMGYPFGDPLSKKLVGFMPENPYFPSDVTIENYLAQTALLKKIPKDKVWPEIEYKLKKVGMFEARHLTFAECSKGMIQRAGLANALLGEPQLLILDEPMSGLDPLGRLDVQNIIRREREKGHTVFFSSHIMSDIEAVCDRVGVMVKGTLTAVLPASEFMGESDTDLVDVEIIKSGVLSPEFLSPLCEKVHLRGDRFFLTIQGQAGLKNLIEHLGKNSSLIISVLPHTRGLEAKFFQPAAKEQPKEVGAGTNLSK